MENPSYKKMGRKKAQDAQKKEVRQKGAATRWIDRSAGDSGDVDDSLFILRFFVADPSSL